MWKKAYTNFNARLFFYLTFTRKVSNTFTFKYNYVPSTLQYNKAKYQYTYHMNYLYVQIFAYHSFNTIKYQVPLNMISQIKVLAIPYHL